MGQASQGSGAEAAAAALGMQSISLRCLGLTWDHPEQGQPEEERGQAGDSKAGFLPEILGEGDSVSLLSTGLMSLAGLALGLPRSRRAS